MTSLPVWLVTGDVPVSGTRSLRGHGGFGGSPKDLGDDFDSYPGVRHFCVRASSGLLLATMRQVPASARLLECWTGDEIAVPCKVASADVSRVVTLPEFRGMGLASVLVSFALLQGARQGISCFRLECRPSNAEYWAMFGFTAEPENRKSRDVPLGEPVEVVVMTTCTAKQVGRWHTRLEQGIRGLSKAGLELQ